MDLNDDANASVEELILERLSASGLPNRADDLVVAALLGDDQLPAAVHADSQPQSQPKRLPDSKAAQPTSVYLQSVIGPVRLEGTSTQRRVTLDVTVDGITGAALSVMSQGELHALGLALFLPRATAADSPFRFVVIDDPVQSMDPAKVDGLARLLAQAAQDRQVVVFTHDDRLPEAMRRLELPATIWEVTRREHSVVELKKNDDPVLRYLDDGRAMALTDQLPDQVRAVVVAGYCRNALEAACHQAIRARRIRAGARHADVERALDQAQTLHDVVALALFDDVSQGNQVVSKLRQLRGQSAVDAFMAAKKGTHDAYKGDLRNLVKATGRLAEALDLREHAVVAGLPTG